MSFEIPVSQPDLSLIERAYLLEAFDSGWISSNGDFVNTFEKRWSQECDSKFALSVANGTVALHLILKALDIGPGDEVIVPSLTFIATANAVSYVGARVVFADSNMDSWNIDSKHVETLITSKTKAIIGVHLYGNPCDMSRLKELSERFGIYLIEDAAEAPFASINGVKTGSFGIAASFSFYGNKVLTCGEGGVVTTSDLELFNRMKLLRGQGMDPARRYYFKEIGFNFRLTNLQCAILNGQLDRKNKILKERFRIFNLYTEMLSEYPIVKFQQIKSDHQICPWLFTVFFDDESSKIRDKVTDNLSMNGIETRPMFIPVHLLPAYSDYNQLNLQNAYRLSKGGLSLPTYSNLKQNQIEKIVNIISSTVN